MRSQDSFTLVELLITITLIGIMAATVVLVINPAQLLAQGRDVRRIGDLGSINQAVASYIYQGPGATGLGSPDVVYVSLPDPTLTGSQTSTCSSLGLPALPTGWTYNCVSQQNLFNTNGTGWMPVNLSQIPGGSPISALPVDPTNSPTGGEYYTYATNGTNYELTAYFESNKYQATAAADGGVDPTTYEVGNDLALTPFLHGLVGSWEFDNLASGVGAVTVDSSGLNNNGILGDATSTGTGPFHKVQGCVKGYCYLFDGTDDYISLPTSTQINPPLSETIWIDPVTSCGSNEGMYIMAADPGPRILLNPSCNPGASVSFTNGGWQWIGDSSYVVPFNSWTFIAYVVTETGQYLYVNGNLVAQGALPGGTINYSSTNPLAFGADFYGSYHEFWSGELDRAKLFDAALTSTQIQDIYNTEKPQ